jgi:hypothetical protein
MKAPGPTDQQVLKTLQQTEKNYEEVFEKVMKMEGDNT